MAIDEADSADPSGFSADDASDDSSAEASEPEPTRGSSVRVGSYTWADFMEEFGHGTEVSTLYPDGTDVPDDQLGLDAESRSVVPSGADWDRVSFDPEAYLGYDPDDLSTLISETFAPNANLLQEAFLDYVDPETTPVTKDVYTWEHYKWEYYYDADGNRPREKGGEIDRFDGADALGFEPDDVERMLHEGGNAAMALDDIVQERTVNVNDELDEDVFFSTIEGHTTVVNRYDLEKAVPAEKKTHFVEVERYWVNKPYAFVIIFHSDKENEKKYYLVEPYCNEIEQELQAFLSGKLRTAIKYSEEGVKSKGDEEGRRNVIERETRRLLKRYDLFEKTGGSTTKGLVETLRELLDEDETGGGDHEPSPGQLAGMLVRPEPIVLAEDPDTLSEYQVEKLLYLLKRDFIGYERIDGIKHDINVEDVSCDGYNSPVFVYHSEYEQIISNIHHGEAELDDFVVKLAQRSGKGISKRLPQVDATLPDGSRAQLTLGSEVSDHGTNYTIRQFKDVPFTPIDLINWNTFSLDEMAFLWLCIENHKSLIFAGGTASGKTTSLNAVSLFIPSNTKIVSIEDTREVELPQRNWIASMTRPSFSDDATGDIDEFDLLEAALRQRPDYIVMGEIRGEEGRTLFQVMSTGHTTYTTFHADSVDEVLKRFTTDPINVSKTMFTALDLVSIQTQTRVQGRKVRRNKSLTEINHYEAEHDEINVQDVYQWQAETDEYLKMGDSNTLEEIQFDRGWNYEKLADELFKRRVILAYLIKNELSTYAEVAATVQAFINDPDTILTLIANGRLEESLEDLREMESVLIDVDPEKEELVPRPDPTTETYNLAMDILERAEESLFDEYRGKVPSGLASALGDVRPADSIDVGDDEAGLGDEPAFDPGPDDGSEWGVDDGPATFSFDEGFSGGADAPSWLDPDGDAGGGETAQASPSETGLRPVEGESAADSSPGGTDRPSTPTGESRPERPQLESGEQSVGSDGSPAGQRRPELEAGPESDGPRPAESAGGDRQRPAEPRSPDTAVDDAEDETDIEALFSDMGNTLAELESGNPAPVDEAEDSADGGDDAVESIFGDRDMDSIFDEPGVDAADELDTDVAESSTAESIGDERSRTGRDESSGRADTAEGDRRSSSASADDEGSIFGSGSDSPFSDGGDADDDANGDDGFLFASETGSAGGESTDSAAGENHDSIFGADSDRTSGGDADDGKSPAEAGGADPESDAGPNGPPRSIFEVEEGEDEADVGDQTGEDEADVDGSAPGDDGDEDGSTGSEEDRA